MAVQQARMQSGGQGSLSQEAEAVLLLKATRMNTLSKLTFTDANRFEQLCKDLFPGVTVEDMAYVDLEREIDTACEKMKLALIPMQKSQRRGKLGAAASNRHSEPLPKAASGARARAQDGARYLSFRARVAPVCGQRSLGIRILLKASPRFQDIAGSHC